MLGRGVTSIRSSPSIKCAFFTRRGRESRKLKTRWRSGMDSNFRYRGWEVLNLFPYERSCEHPLVCLFLQRLQPAQLSFIDLLDGVIRLGLWHVWVLFALGLRLSQFLIVTQNSRRPVGEREH